MLFDSVAIVGVGLIGGSIGLATKTRNVARSVIGVGRNPATLTRAQELGALDEWSTDLVQGVRTADVIVVCSPVDHIARQILEAATAAKPGAIFTDAGSTKANIVRRVEAELPEHVVFLGSHPLAGSEKQGVEHARADLFVNRVCVLTPTENTPPPTQERVTAFWEALGMRVNYLSPEEHDLALATTSHLPHLIASLLANQLPEAWADYAATGFRDTTRIASGDPVLWAAIARENAEALNDTLTAFGDRLDELRAAVATKNTDELIRLLTTAKKVRDDLGN
jgi:cyclohexadieny/prephenate dehydrogenase